MMKRTADYEILDVILNRWSSRAMSGESIPTIDILRILEAARWAPSSYNNQPWRFIVAQRGTPSFDVMLNLMAESNRIWAQRAGVIIAVISHKNFEYNNKPSRTHTLDAGAATENMALQAHALGLVCHGMEGFDYDRARTALAVPEDYDIEALYVLGKPGDKALLPQNLQDRELPSERKPVKELVFEGTFGKAPSFIK